MAHAMTRTGLGVASDVDVIALDPSNCLAKNLAAHADTWGRQPELASANADRMRLDPPSATGPASGPSLSYRLDTGWVAAHDPHDPWREAHDALARARGDRPMPALIGVIGVGLGYTVELLLREASAPRVIACEVDPALMAIALGARDWSDAIRARRLMFISGPRFAGKGELWRLATPGSADPLLVLDPVLACADLDAARTAATLVVKAHADANANDDARKAFAGRYLLNTLANLPHVVGAPSGAALAGTRRSQPLLVVAAGPSLDRTLPVLAAMTLRPTIVAVDTAMSPLLAAGVEPDFVVALDPGEVNARHLLEPPMPAHAWLVTEGSVQPSVLDRFAGRVIPFRVATHHPWPWLQRAGIDAPTLTVWGSVATAALDWAMHLGGDPIIFLGLDLAYTERQPYCRHTVYEWNWKRAMGRGLTMREVWDIDMGRAPHIETTDIEGAPIVSTAVLISVRDWIVSRVNDCRGRQFINASGGGILHGGSIVVQDLAQAVADSSESEAGPAISGAPDDAAHARVVDAVAEMLEQSSSDARETRRLWQAFGEPNLDEARLDAALGSALRTLTERARVA